MTARSFKELPKTIFAPFLFFGLPLLILSILYLIFEPWKFDFRVLILFLIYSLLLFFFYNKSNQKVEKQGYMIIIMLIVEIILFPISITLLSTGVTIVLLVNYCWLLFSLAASIIPIAFIIKKVVIYVIGLFHKESFEFETNSIVKIQVLEKDFPLPDTKDLSFFSLNRILKVFAFWVIIPFTVLPMPVDFGNDFILHPQFFSFFLIIILVISFPFAYIHHQNYKLDLKFILKTLNSNESKTKEVPFSKDLTYFLKLGFIMGVILKLTSILDELIKMNAAETAFILMYFLVIYMMVKYIFVSLYFLQFTINYIRQSRRFKAIQAKLESIRIKTFNFVTSLIKWIPSKLHDLEKSIREISPKLLNTTNEGNWKN